MDGTRRQLFSGSRFTREQDGHVAVGRQLKPPEHLAHPLALSHHVEERFVMSSQGRENLQFLVRLHHRRHVEESSDRTGDLARIVAHQTDIAVQEDLATVLGQNLALLFADAVSRFRMSKQLLNPTEPRAIGSLEQRARLADHFVFRIAGDPFRRPVPRQEPALGVDRKDAGRRNVDDPRENFGRFPKIEFHAFGPVDLDCP